MSALGSDFGFGLGNFGPLTIGGDPFGGATGFGFSIPQGDPGAIESAGNGIQQIGTAFEEQGRSLNAGARIAVDADGGWQGTASGAYAAASGRLVSTLAANAGACRDAAKALDRLSTALWHAQSVTKQALADCESAQRELTRQQGIAQTASQQAQNSADSARVTAPLHPAAAAAMNREAQIAGQTASDAQAAVLHTLSRWGEYTAIGVCVVGSDGACAGAVRVALVADTANNAASATSLPNFLAREGVTGAETVVVGGGGIVVTSLGKAGLLEGAFPTSKLGQTRSSSTSRPPAEW